MTIRLTSPRAGRLSSPEPEHLCPRLRRFTSTLSVTAPRAGWIATLDSSGPFAERGEGPVDAAAVLCHRGVSLAPANLVPVRVYAPQVCLRTDSQAADDQPNSGARVEAGE